MEITDLTTKKFPSSVFDLSAGLSKQQMRMGPGSEQ
jgi:hypothetical protein